MAKSGWDGSLSWSEFRVAANSFLERWNNSMISTLPECSWSELSSPKPPRISSHQAEGYLSLENVLIRNHTKKNYKEESEVREDVDGCSGQDETLDDASLVLSYDEEFHRFDFHIVYSSSYRVPVLYFRGYSVDGQPLTSDEIENDLSADSAKLAMESKWTFITQEEHPFLNRPWYTLHPCGTSEWIKLLLDADSSQATEGPRFEKYLFSWFSVVGQVFDLKIPIQMLTSFEEL